MSEGPWTQYQPPQEGPWTSYALEEGEKRVRELREKNPQPPSQSVISRTFSKENLPVAGAIAGGVVGAVTPFPGGAFAGSQILGGLLGTIAGTSIGTSAKQLKEQSEGNVKTVRETLGEQVTNVAEQALWDMTGNVIGSGVSKSVNAMLPKPREGAEVAQAALRSQGGSLSASQAVESPTLNLAESFARAGAGGKGQFITLDKHNADALQAIKDSLISSISKDPANDRVAGKMFQDAISRGEAAHSAASTALYKQFDDRVGDVVVPTTEVKDLGLKLVSQFERIGGVGKSEAGGRLLDQLSKLPNELSFSDAHILRSNLLATIRDLKASGQETVALRSATLAAREIEKSMEQSAKGLPGDLYGEYRQISAFYKKGKDAFNNDIINSLVTAQPERVGETLFRTGNVSEIIQAKASLRQASQLDKTVNPDEALKKLQAGYLNGLLTSRAAVNVEGETTAQNLMKTLADAKTNRQFAVMFNESQREAIADFGRTAFLTLRNKPSQFGILAPLLQAGAIGDLVSGAAGSPISTKSPALDVGILVSPYALATILTNPRAVSILARGLQLPPGTIGGPAMAKLVAEMSKVTQEQ